MTDTHVVLVAATVFIGLALLVVVLIVLAVVGLWKLARRTERRNPR